MEAPQNLAEHCVRLRTLFTEFLGNFSLALAALQCLFHHWWHSSVPLLKVTNCYGPHYRRHLYQERQDMLLSQYKFRSVQVQILISYLIKPFVPTCIALGRYPERYRMNTIKYKHSNRSCGRGPPWAGVGIWQLFVRETYLLRTVPVGTV